jgi:thioredoxin-like negative regulator of GroEL
MENQAPQENNKNLNLKTYLEKGISYTQYRGEMKKEIDTNREGDMSAYIKINEQRMNRLDKKAILSEEIIKSIESLENKKYWLVLTEHWCGDAAQIVPVLAKIANESNGKIELKLIYRDENLELMDQFLTNNGRSIPKLIQLDQNHIIENDWGPRPKIAQEMVMALRANPETAASYSEHLHKWYAQNKQVNIQEELLKIILE